MIFVYLFFYLIVFQTFLQIPRVIVGSDPNKLLGVYKATCVSYGMFLLACCWMALREFCHSQFWTHNWHWENGKNSGDFCGKRHEAPTPTAKTTWHSLTFDMRKSKQKIVWKTESTKFKGGLYTLKKQETTSIVKGSVNETTLFANVNHLPLAHSIAGCPTPKIKKTLRFTKEHWSGSQNLIATNPLWQKPPIYHLYDTLILPKPKRIGGHFKPSTSPKQNPISHQNARVTWKVLPPLEVGLLFFSPIPTPLYTQTKKQIHEYWVLPKHCNSGTWRLIKGPD